MCNEPKKEPVKPKEDLSGRDRLVGNVIFSWAAHFVFIIAGFIMPRMIDEKLGQDLLGVWDFCWSLVSYFMLVQAGVASSVNRYIAKYRAAADLAGVNKIVSSASFILFFAGLLVLVLTVTVSLLMPAFFGERLGVHLPQARWVVLLLGTGLGCEMALGAFAGVLTGCHRWGVHNFIKSGWHAVSIAAMIIVLLSGFGLPELALAYLAGQILASFSRVIMAHRVCPGLRLRPCLITLDTIGKLFIFGGKTLIPSVSDLLLNQTVCVVIMAYLGPASLALYARPRSLLRHLTTLVGKMAFVLTPTASSLQSAGDLKGISELLIKSVRYSLYMTLPPVLVLVVFGGEILKLWMGPDYANGVLPAILAAGFTASIANLPLISILAGLNAHGRAGLAQLAASVVSVGLTILSLGPLDLGLTGLAVAVTLPLTAMNLVYLPFYICRKLELDFRVYFKSVFIKPIIYVLPLTVCLVVAKQFFITKPLLGLVCGGAVGGLVLMFIYWRNVLPDRIKSRAYCLFKAATT